MINIARAQAAKESMEFDIGLLRRSIKEKVRLNSPYSIVGSRARAVVFASRSLAVFLGVDRVRVLQLAKVAAEIGEKDKGRITKSEEAVLRENKLAGEATAAGRVYLFATDGEGGGVFIPLKDRTACMLMALGRLPQEAKEAMAAEGLKLSMGPAGLIEAYAFSQEVSSEGLERMARHYRESGDPEMEYYAIAMHLGWKASAPEVAIKPPRD